MSTDDVNGNVSGKEKANQDITLDVLINHSESRIKIYRKKIDNLRKSIIFFKKKQIPERNFLSRRVLNRERHDKYLDTY